MSPSEQRTIFVESSPISEHSLRPDVYDHERFVPQVCMPCITVRALLLADRPDLVAQTSHDHTHVLFNRVCSCHRKLLQNSAQITSLAPLWAGASVVGIILQTSNGGSSEAAQRWKGRDCTVSVVFSNTSVIFL